MKFFTYIALLCVTSLFAQSRTLSATKPMSSSLAQVKLSSSSLSAKPLSSTPVMSLKGLLSSSSISRANDPKTATELKLKFDSIARVQQPSLSASSSLQSSAPVPTTPVIQLSLREQLKDSLVSLSFKKTRIQDVVRIINASYGINVLVQQGVEAMIDVHLDKVPVVEALEALCKAQGLELSDDGKVFLIQKPTVKSYQMIEANQQKVDLDVQNQDVKSFIKDYANKTGLKVLASPELKGAVSGGWSKQPALDAFKALMDAHGYGMRYKGDFLIVEPGEGTPNGSPNQGGARAGGSGRSGLQVDFHQGKFTIIADNADLSDVLKAIAKEANLNILFYGDIREAVTARLSKVSLEEAISSVMKGSRFTYTRSSDSTLLVGSKDPKSESGKILTSYEVYKLKHVKAEDVIKLLPGSIPPTALTVHKEQNAVIITGTSVEIEGIKKYLDLLDQPVPQVEMECIIVEVSKGNNDEYGVRTQAPSATGQSADNGPNLLLNVSRGSESTIWHREVNGVYSTIGLLPNDFLVQLTALQSRNKAKVLAMPRVTTVNGNKSNIQVTNTSHYPVNTVSKDGFPVSDYKPINDGITLDITPYITSGGEITIDIRPEIKTARVTSATDRPSDISSRSLQTTIKLRDGQTAVLGGLIQNNQSRIREGVPILGSIPILGWLFSYHKTVETTTELMIFVTPRVIPPQGEAIDPSKEIKQIEDRSSIGDYQKFLQKEKP